MEDIFITGKLDNKTLKQVESACTAYHINQLLLKT